MTRQDEPGPPHQAADPPPAPPETTHPGPGGGPLPAPAAAPPTPEAASRATPSDPPPGSFILQTTLLGPLTVPDGAAHAAELEELSRRAAVYATRARGDGTRRAYRSAWRQYEAWCHSLGREPLAADPDTIAMYVVRCADQGFAVSSIRVHLAAIRTAHLLAGRALDLRHPRLAMVVEGITRSKGVRPRRQAAPAVPGVLRLMLAARPARRHAARRQGPGDAAAGLRRRAAPLRAGLPHPGRRRDRARAAGSSSWCAARRPTSRARGRTSPSGPTPTNPASARSPPWRPGWRIAARHADLDWTASASARAERPLFCAVTKTGRLSGAALSDKAVARLVKQAALDAGLDPERYSGHSLRAGLATAAGDAGAGLAELMRQTRHKSTEVALGYLRPADLWRNNVTEGVFRAAGRKD